MTMARWNPLRDLEAMEREMSRAFEAPLFRLAPWARGLVAEASEIDVYETGDAVVVKAFLPGVKPEDVKVTINRNTVQIEGESREDQEIKKEQYHRQEHRYGRFSRIVTLPVYADTDKAEAAYDNGALTITVPKTEQVKARPVEIKVAPNGNSKAAKEG